jgi:hypothetical protein
MIEYKFPEEKTIAFYYADVLKNPEAKIIINNGFVNDRNQAIALKDFYWAMVDESVKDQGAGLDLMKADGVEFWMESIFHSFNGYLVSNGYQAEWDIE